MSPLLLVDSFYTWDWCPGFELSPEGQLSTGIKMKRQRPTTDDAGTLGVPSPHQTPTGSTKTAKSAPTNNAHQEIDD